MVNVELSVKQRNLLKVAISGWSLFLCMFAAVYFLVFWHTGFVYTHFFYVPVVLMSWWWKRKGVILTLYLALFTVTCNLFLAPNVSIVNELVRAPMLLFISILTCVIFEHKQRIEEKLRVLAKFPSENPNSVVRIAKDGTVLYANPAANSQLSELKVEIGKPAPPHLRRLVVDALNSGLKKEVEVEHRNRVFFLTLAPVTEAAYVNVYGLDITERKLMQQSITESEEKFRSITDSALDAIVMIDDKQKIVYWNPAAEKIFGYKKEEALDKHFSLLVPQHLHGHMEKGIEKIDKNSSKPLAKGTFETVGRKKNGQEFPMEISGSQLQIRGNSYSVTIIRDATDRKRMQKKLKDYSSHLKDMVELRTVQLKDANERLVKSERLATIGELAGMIGHDLRNPLAGIKNATYFLKKKGATIPEAEAKAMLEIIEKGIDHSDKIINDLLDYAREMHLELQARSPRKLLTEALTLISVPEKVKIINNISDELSVRIDQNKMERVFINLVKNAIDAMPNGGTLTINCKQTNANAEISFADTGVGIPEKILPKLFSPLFTTKAQGMGFGLAICKRIIEAHGGTITVETEKGKGTTFTVTLKTEPKLEVGGEKVWINMPESLLLTTMKA
jgi:two-component system sensor kinase FixL